MEYRKPEIVASAAAVTAIQGAKNGEFEDQRDVYQPLQTAAAYEADE